MSIDVLACPAGPMEGPEPDAPLAVPGSGLPARMGCAPIVPVILSGGSGAHLWPLSRDSHPKQLWPLTSERTLLQEAALRASGALADGLPLAPPLVLCNQEHRFLVAAQLQAAGVKDARILLEPAGWSNAPAIAAAALLAAEADPEAMLWIMAADAAIADMRALHQVLPLATMAAREGRIVTFGVKPTAPESGYGYIETEELLEYLPGSWSIARIVEQPAADAAADLVASGRHLWSTGMFVSAAATLLEELAAHAPEILHQARVAVRHCQRDLDFLRLDATALPASPDPGLESAVIGRSRRSLVMPVDIGWSDIGSWDALWKASRKDDRGNVVLGDAVLENAENCYVRSDGILTAVVGLKDAAVVVTGDAVLAMHRDQAQELQAVMHRLRRQGRKEAEAHNRCHRPWGYYESLILQRRFQVKRIVVEPGHKLSLQKHFHRAEHWVVVQGTALVTRDAEHMLIRENESVYLPLGCVHRLENPGRIPLMLIEVQIGSYLEEDDIVRFADDYARP